MTMANKGSTITMRPEGCMSRMHTCLLYTGVKDIQKYLKGTNGKEVRMLKTHKCVPKTAHIRMCFV